MSKIAPLPQVSYPHVLGCDIYHGDGPVQMHALVDAGIKFVYFKTSQGTSYTDPTFADNIKRARSVGLIAGAYHFYDPKVDPKKQAAYFLAHAPVVKGDLVHCIDNETQGPTAAVDTYACAKEMKRLTGRWPCIYSGDSMFQDELAKYFKPPADYFLWIARYGHEPQAPCAIWQYSDAGRIQGVPHALDLNVFRGDIEALKTHCYK